MNTEHRRLRSYAWAAMLARLRDLYPIEYATLLAAHHRTPNPTQKASTALRQLHPAYAADLYRQEVLARGLPEPKAQAGAVAVVSTVDLSPRQIQILELLAAGLQQPEIAAKIFVSVATVKTHVLRIFAVLGARTAAQAVAVAYQRGILAVDPDTAMRAESDAILTRPVPDGFRVALLPWEQAS